MIVFLFLSVYDADMTVSRYIIYVKILFKIDLDFHEIQLGWGSQFNYCFLKIGIRKNGKIGR